MDLPLNVQSLAREAGKVYDTLFAFASNLKVTKEL